MKNIFGICLLVTISGCSTSGLDVDSHVPSALFFSPETTGHTLGGRMQAMIGSAHKLSLARSHQSASILSSNPSAVQVNTTTEVEPTWNMGVAGALGLFKRLDLTIETRTESPARVGLQWQLIGDEVPTTGLKFSLISSVGYNKDDEVSAKQSWGDQSEKLSNVTAKTRDKSWAGGFSTGYRLHEAVILFVSGNYQEDDFTSDLSIQGGTTHHMENFTKTTTGVAGVLLSSGSQEKGAVFVHLEGGFSKIDTKVGPDQTRTVWGASFGGRF